MEILLGYLQLHTVEDEKRNQTITNLFVELLFTFKVDLAQTRVCLMYYNQCLHDSKKNPEMVFMPLEMKAKQLQK